MGDTGEKLFKSTGLGFLYDSTKPPPPPEIPDLPAPVEEVDVDVAEQTAKRRLKSRQGRQSTILASKTPTGKKTVLG